MPHRVQLSRAKGWRMPPDTIKVDRITKWGNPFLPTMLYVAGPAAKKAGGIKPGDAIGVAGAVAAFETLMRTNLRKDADRTRTLLEPLRGKNLACWCRLDKPCHADVLLRLANEAA